MNDVEAPAPATLRPDLSPETIAWAEQNDIPLEALPNLDKLVVEDGKPLDSTFAEKQYRLLTEPLYASWPGPGEGRPFLALANVGLFGQHNRPGLAPDVMLSVDTRLGPGLSRRENRSYFVWEVGKPPDVIVEVVSDRRGDEEGYKRDQYAFMRVLHYAIFDPQEHLGHGVLRAFELRDGVYRPLERPWFPVANLGLALWQGTYEGHEERWLRWCDAAGRLIPTGRERAEQERQRAEQAERERDQERQRREQLEARLRSLGVDPNT
jgi:hypothetical protein